MLDLLKFDITARDRASQHLDRMRKDLGGIKGALAGLNDRAKRAGKAMRNIGVGMSAGVTAPLVLLGKESLRLYDQQVEAEKTVQQAIASTGGAAGKTIGDLKGLASALQGVTTFGDEDILRNVTAPMLTFTKVQGEVFDRAQANVLDMSTLLKMDLKSASILVGKALNDPMKGLSALSRSGVQFSESQKKVIKQLVETGKVADAQSLILDELETQFKGQAAAAAEAPLGQWKQLSNAIGDVKEELGKEIVPFLKPLAEQVKGAIQWFAALSPEVKRNVVVIGGLAAVIGPVVGVLGLVTLGITGLTGALSAMGAALLANPILAIIALIAGGAYLIYRNWDAVSGWFVGLWDRVKTASAEGWARIKAKISEYAPGWLKAAWNIVTAYYTALWADVKAAWAFGWDAIKGLVTGKYSPQEVLYNAWQGIGTWFTARSADVKAAFVEIWEAIKEEVSQWPGRMVQWGKDTIGGLLDGMRTRNQEVYDESAAAASRIMRGITDPLDIQSPSRVMMGYGRNIMEGLGIGIRDNAGIAIEEMQGVAGTISDTAKGGLNLMGSLRDGAKTVFRDVLTGAKSFKSSLSGVLSGLGNRFLNAGIDKAFGALWPLAKGGVVSGGRIQAFASGGVVSSPTYFPLNRGTGLMGEAGPEAILPLSRGRDGKLGVRAQGGAARGEAVQFNYAPVIDARGADQAAVTRLEMEMRRMQQEFPHQVQKVLRKGRNSRANLAWERG